MPWKASRTTSDAACGLTAWRPLGLRRQRAVTRRRAHHFGGPVHQNVESALTPSRCLSIRIKHLWNGASVAHLLQEGHGVYT